MGETIYVRLERGVHADFFKASAQEIVKTRADKGCELAGIYFVVIYSSYMVCEMNRIEPHALQTETTF